MTYLKTSAKGIIFSVVIYYFLIYQCEEELFWRKPLDERLKIMDYPVERHYVITDDKYNITLFRIGKKGSKEFSTKGKPVIFVPQFLNCIDTYVSNEEHLAPGLVFANKGFDIWLMSTRGGEYSPNYHIPEGHSFHDIGYYDLPKSYEYIYKINPQNISAVGHSQGGNTILVSLTEKRIQNVGKVIMFAPGPFARHASGFLPYFVNSTLVDYMALHYKTLNLQPTSFIFKFVKYSHTICRYLLSVVTDSYESDVNIAQLYKLTMHTPQPQSIKNLVHIKQILNKGRFQKFDYGAEKNMELYGISEAPEYDLLSITDSIHLFYGPHDILTRAPDTTDFYEILKKSKARNVTYSFYPTVGHMSFILDAKAEFLKEMIEILESD